jgi:Zn-dependent membrane protease YugP
MRSVLSAVVVVVTLAASALWLSACKSSHEEGVSSNYMTQWTTVNANTQTTTDTAKRVLEQEGLKEVNASSTSMDGTASGKMANGTKVKVSVRKKNDTASEASVNVGSMGDPQFGAEIAKKIKDQAEMKM